MVFADMRTSISAGFFLFGLALASFALFLHPMDPADFLAKAVFSPQETFSLVYGYIQSMAFWFSVACMAIGIAGMLVAVLQRRQRRQLVPQFDDRRMDGEDGEENWMFL